MLLIDLVFLEQQPFRHLFSSTENGLAFIHRILLIMVYNSMKNYAISLLFKYLLFIIRTWVWVNSSHQNAYFGKLVFKITDFFEIFEIDWRIYLIKFRYIFFFFPLQIVLFTIKRVFIRHSAKRLKDNY